MLETRKKRLQQGSRNELTSKIEELEAINQMIAHNLRGAAANIKMLAEVLINKNIPDNCQENGGDNIFTISEAIGHIYECSKSMLETLNVMMAIAEIQLDENVKYEECNIEDIVCHIIEQMNGLIQQKSAVIDIDLTITHINYPSQYMESILYNIIRNAIKYSKETVPLKVLISTYDKDGKVVLSVKDNGVGLDLKLYGRRIFKLYQVFHSGYESKGVGLYIVKKQIESLGGRINVKSTVNEGCEFIVVF